MKSLIYLFISVFIALTLTSAVQKSSENSKSITLQSTDKNVGSVTLKQSADIISARLKQFGLNDSEVKVLASKGQVIILLPAKTDISGFEGLLTSKGEVCFYETYTQAEISDLFKPDNKLFKLLSGYKGNKELSDPSVGCTNSDNKKKVNEYLQSAVPPSNCKLLWGNKSEKSGYCLFALKTNMEGNPLLVRSDIESVKITTGKDPMDQKIQIRLKPAAVSIFADATEKNLNKAIAIVIDNQVYAYPVVKSAIKGGEIEVTGNFTKSEANYFPTLFNSEQLPVGFKLLK
jgi:preprotein translocase subunit SecD